MKKEKNKKTHKIEKEQKGREKASEKLKSKKSKIPFFRKITNFLKSIRKNKGLSEQEKIHKEKKKSLPVTRKKIIINLSISVLLTIIVFLFSRKILTAIISFFFIFFFSIAYLFLKKKLKESEKIKKMESVFPDFLQLMASNLRAGMTTDRSLLLSARKEFDPLDKEIMKLGKDLVTGKKIESALVEMSKRIKSEKIRKTINLIVSGIKSGGNMSTLLEQTATNMREKNFVEKRASSNVLMYAIFIFFATAVGAPTLFALSSILVEVLSGVLATVPTIPTDVNLPFTLTKINISPTFITYFSLVFLIATDILGSLVLGLVNKGEEKAGVKYFIPLIGISVFVFFAIRIALGSYFSNLF